MRTRARAINGTRCVHEKAVSDFGVFQLSNTLLLFRDTLRNPRTGFLITDVIERSLAINRDLPKTKKGLNKRRAH